MTEKMLLLIFNEFQKFIVKIPNVIYEKLSVAFLNVIYEHLRVAFLNVLSIFLYNENNHK